MTGMGTRLTTTSHAILGLLSIAPMSGYDLYQAVEGSTGHFWPISKSQVYAELAHLEPRGLIDGTAVPQERDRKSTRLNSSHERKSYAVFRLKRIIGHVEPQRRHYDEIIGECGHVAAVRRHCTVTELPFT